MDPSKAFEYKTRGLKFFLLELLQKRELYDLYVSNRHIESRLSYHYKEKFDESDCKIYLIYGGGMYKTNI